jgi:ADP-ribosyl-[dinitrogen reductase] hydrolase
MAVNNSKGCGTIMRVAPVAFFGSRSNVRALAIETSALTHGHPTGQLAAAAWAEILADVLEGEDLEGAARAIASSYSMIPDGDETVRAIQAACDAPRDGNPGTVESLGGGWVAEEALAIALYAGLASDNFDQGIRAAVMHSGDSDSTGAIAGNLLGLLYPEEVLAHPWVRQLECSDLIVRIARDLGNAMGFDEDQFDDYPGW